MEPYEVNVVLKEDMVDCLMDCIGVLVVVDYETIIVDSWIMVVVVIIGMVRMPEDIVLVFDDIKLRVDVDVVVHNTFNSDLVMDEIVVAVGEVYFVHNGDVSDAMVAVVIKVLYKGTTQIELIIAEILLVLDIVINYVDAVEVDQKHVLKVIEICMANDGVDC